MLSTSPSLCIPSNAEFLPLSINIWDCISGEETTPNNTSSLVIGSATTVLSVIPLDSIKNK